nr:capsid protein [Apis mellifera virus-14]
MPYRRSSRSRSRSVRRRRFSRSSSRRFRSRSSSYSVSGYKVRRAGGPGYRNTQTPTKHSWALGSPSYSVQTGRLPFARGGLYRLPYSESFAIGADGTTGLSAVSSTFALNGPYDPLVQIGGMQPLQWDQVAFMYQKYIVHKAVCTVTFNNPQQDGLLVGIRVRSVNNPVSTSNRTIAEIKEMDNTRSTWVNDSGNQTRIFKFTVRPWDIAGLTKVQYMCDRQDYQAAINTNPSWFCYLEPFALATITGEINVVRCTVRIVYYIQFMEGQTKLDV